MTLLLLDRFLPDGPVHLVGDDTVESHPGRRVYGKGRHRDPVRSSHAYTAWRYGHKWVVITVLIRFPFATRPWALPGLADLYRPPKMSRAEGCRHRTPAQLACRLLRLILLRFPDRKVDGQVARVATQKFFVTFPRDKDTRALIEALARYEYQGSKSGQFEGAEGHKRIVSRWVRSNEGRVISALQPREDVRPSDAVRATTQLLAVTAIIRERKRLPDSAPEFLATLLKPLTDGHEKVIRLPRSRVAGEPLSETTPNLLTPAAWSHSQNAGKT